jgi:hypothetical protein
LLRTALRRQMPGGASKLTTSEAGGFRQPVLKLLQLGAPLNLNVTRALPVAKLHHLKKAWIPATLQPRWATINYTGKPGLKIKRGKWRP